jgi:hypothetical protein
MMGKIAEFSIDTKSFVNYPFAWWRQGRWQMADGRRKKGLQAKRGLSRRIWYDEC